MNTPKVINATRVGDDEYHAILHGPDGVTVSESSIPFARLQELAGAGYTVEVDQSGHRTATEPAHYVLALRGPLADGTTIDGIGGVGGVGTEGLA